MTKPKTPDRQTLALIGMSLLCVQQAEQVLSSAVNIIFDRHDIDLTEQSGAKRRQTLGDFMLRLKRRVKIEHGVKERLFKFLEMRNKFIHNLKDVPGWDLDTEAGRETAKMFLAELSYSAIAITCLFMTLFSVSAKDDYGEDLFKDHDEEIRRRAAAIEEIFGANARKLLAGRYQRPMSYSSKPSNKRA